MDHTKGPKLSICPNPSHGRTIIRLSPDSPSLNIGGKLMIYSITGSLVDELELRDNEFIWNNNSVPNGVYLVKLKGIQNYLGKRIVLIR